MAQYYLTNEQASRLEDMARKHNESIDTFINVTLKEHFGTDKITTRQWFEAQQLINAQNFYEKGHTILLLIREFGIDCKQNMQDSKLYCPELHLYN